MESDLFTYPLILILAIILHGLLIASEKAIVAIRPYAIKDLSSKGVGRADIIKRLRSNPERFFLLIRTSCIIIITATSIYSGVVGLKLVSGWIQGLIQVELNSYLLPISSVVLIAITILLFIFSNEFFSRLIPESKQESFALSSSMPLWGLQILLSPFLIVIDWCMRSILRLVGRGKIVGLPDSFSESEIRMVLRDGYLNNSLNAYEKKIFYSMLEFSDTDVRRAMTPRTDIVAFDINDSVEEILKRATEDKFSRFPVYEENIDNIKGVVHSRDLLYVFTNKELFTFGDIIREAYFVPDSKPVVELLREMQQKKTHMAIVLDEFGGTGGIITLEDILEEIVGDIQDEYDQEISKIIFINPNKAQVLASMPIDEFADEFNVEVEEGEFDTLAGMLVSGLGKIPSRGEVYNFNGYSLEVREKEGHRIKTLIARRMLTGEDKV